MTGLLVFYFLLLPFQWALSPVPGIDLALIRVVTPVIFIIWIGYGLLRKKMVLPAMLPSFFLITFLFVSLISLFWAENVFFAQRKLLFLFSLTPIFFVLSSWLEEHKEKKSVLLKAFVGGAFFSALCGIGLFVSQFFFGVEKVFSMLTSSLLPFFLGETFARSVAEYPSILVNISGSTLLRASGVFPDPHMFSLYMGLAVPVAGVFYLTASYKKSLWLTVFLVILLADLLSFSRGGYVGLLVGLLVLGFFSLPNIQFNSRRALSVLVTGIVIGSVFFLTPLGPRFFSSFSQEDGSNRERIRLWEEAISHIQERPLLGVGLGNYPLLVKPSASYREPIYAHNLYLDIALEIGLVGLGSFLFLVGVAFLRLKCAWGIKRSPVALALLGSLLVFLGHSLFETPIFSVHILPAALLILAIGVSYNHDESFS